MAALGRALQARGHRFTLFQLPALRGRVQSEQLEFFPIGAEDQESSALAQAVSELGARSGFAAARFTLDCGRRLASLTCASGPDAVTRAGVDLLVIDDNEPAGASVAEHLKIPFVNFGSTPYYRDSTVPPGSAAWDYDPGVLGRTRNAIAYSIFELLVTPIHRVLNRYRRTWGLAPIRRPEDTLSRLAQFSQLVEEFDYPRSKRPAHLYYVGPVVDEQRPVVPFPFERLNGKPLIYASFGSILNIGPEKLDYVVEACEGLDTQLVLSTGGVSPQRFDARTSVIAVPFAPQLELLRRAALCITHAGLNTVMESLRFAVPMICVPITNDQPSVAARVRWLGAGERIPIRKLNAERLQAAIPRVMGSTEIHTAAKALSSAVARAGGAPRAAAIISSLCAA